MALDLSRLRIPGLGGWGDDPLWAGIYDWTVEHERAGGLLWRAGINSDLRLLYDAAAEIGRLPGGSRVLDVPCGGGVALRGIVPGQGLAYVAADISEAMLGRTRAAARARDVQEQVSLVPADVGALPFDDDGFDLVVSFTGLHCFPVPRRAVTEMVRVLKPGGALTGSALFNDTGIRFAPMRVAGRATGLLGPGADADALVEWLTDEGMGQVSMRTSGAIGYFRGVKD
ncbi:MAG: methyltransferase domain-containing protein [Marmoricola sp.]